MASRTIASTIGLVRLSIGGGIRTRTVQILNLPPLPLGYTDKSTLIDHRASPGRRESVVCNIQTFGGGGQNRTDVDELMRLV